MGSSAVGDVLGAATGGRSPSWYRCSKCGGSKDSSSFYCAPCQKEYHKAYRAKNAEQIRERKLRYKMAHPELIKAQKKAYRTRRKEQFYGAIRKWHAEHRDVVNANIAEWKSKNLGKLVEYANRRRARTLAAIGDTTDKDFKAIISRQNGKCYDCKVAFSESLVPSMGHKIPLSRGGSNGPWNIIAQCLPCNQKQGSKIHPDASFTLFDAEAM